MAIEASPITDEQLAKAVTHYDTENAPFKTELGFFDPKNPVFNGKYVYVNIPGGEMFATPYPFRQTEGGFFADGARFFVQQGLVIKAEELEEGSVARMKSTSQELFQLVRNGRRIPVAEIGLGFYALAGVNTYKDSSILSVEKGGPHIGVGHGYESSEAAEIATAAGDFHHTDFVMNNPTIIYTAPNTLQMKLFYPPSRE